MSLTFITVAAGILGCQADDSLEKRAPLGRCLDLSYSAIVSCCLVVFPYHSLLIINREVYTAILTTTLAPHPSTAWDLMSAVSPGKDSVLTSRGM